MSPTTTYLDANERYTIPAARPIAAASSVEFESEPVPRRVGGPAVWAERRGARFTGARRISHWRRARGLTRASAHFPIADQVTRLPLAPKANGVTPDVCAKKRVLNQSTPIFADSIGCGFDPMFVSSDTSPNVRLS